MEHHANTTPYRTLGVGEKSIAFVLDTEASLAPVFARIEAIEAENTARVLAAFQKEGVAQRHFTPTTGYGYDDIGRDTLDRVFAHSLQCQDALVRPHFTSGTHAIFTALSGLLEPGDTLLSITGKPYDTLEAAIGIAGDEPGSLKRLGIQYRQVDLTEDAIDLPKVLAALEDSSIRVVYLQRSRGYAWRNALLPQEMAPIFQAIRQKKSTPFIVVDNCYGEFTQPNEPSAYGADVLIGSLIKNPGGGIAPTGGYIAGTSAAIDRIQGRLTVPGMGREVGSYDASYRPYYQGLFMAPHTVAQSLKSAVLFAGVFERAGLVSMPASDAPRSDIVQALRFQDANGLIAFCKSIQQAAPIDSFVTPEPWDMPGYQSQVIMAAGAFVQGSSIELSADGPITAPYTAYVQGGLTYAHGRMGAMFAVDALVKAGEMRL